MSVLHILITTFIVIFSIAAILTVIYMRKEFNPVLKGKFFQILKSASLVPLLILSILGFAFISIYILTLKMGYQSSNGGTIGIGTAGEVGDLFNGLIAPIIALLSVVLFYKAYREQTKTNEKNDQFQILEYCHERIRELESNTALNNFSSQCDIYLSDSSSVDIKERALVRILQTIEEFDNIGSLINQVEINNAYLNMKYLNVYHGYYLPELEAINNAIVGRFILVGLIDFTISTESRFNEKYLLYLEKLQAIGISDLQN